MPVFIFVIFIYRIIEEIKAYKAKIEGHDDEIKEIKLKIIQIEGGHGLYAGLEATALLTAIKDEKDAIALEKNAIRDCEAAIQQLRAQGKK